MTFKKGDPVQWNWGSSTAVGKVSETFTSDVTRTLKGNEVTREASSDSPAYLVKTEKGDEALKAESELKKATKSALMDAAKKAEIEGRSKMTLDELVSALF